MNKKRDELKYALVFGILIVLLSFLFILENQTNLSFTGYAIFEDSGLENFSQGSYNNTEWNNTRIMLKYWNNSEQELPNNKRNDGYLNMNGNVLLLHMNEASGVIEDFSGENNNGTQNGVVTYGANGKLNNALSFDGVDDYVEINDNKRQFTFNDTSQSLSLWVKSGYNNPTLWIGMISKGNNSSWSNWRIGPKENYCNAHLGFIYNEDNGKVCDDEALEEGVWKNIIVTYNLTTIGLYVDGELVDSSTIFTPISSFNPLYIGKSWADMDWRYFNGTIDEVAIWNKSLSASEISEIYQRQKDHYGGGNSGIYISQIFNAGFDSNWNNLTWIGNEPNKVSFYAVDGSGAVYSSSDYGYNWVEKNSNYGRTSDTVHMFSDSLFIYIISNSNKEVWRSDNGINWIVVNNSFADSNLLVGDVDSNGDLFVVDASGDVYSSSNKGIIWEKRGDFNAGATNNAKGIALNSSDDIFIVDGSGAVYSSSDYGYNWVEVNGGYGGGSGTDDMTENNNSLFILLNKKVYMSNNWGVSWNLINNSFTSYGQDGLKMIADSNNLYITDAKGRVFKSNNQGVSWTEISDFNSNNNNDPKGLTSFIQYSNLNLSVRTCNDSVCSGESWIDITDSSPQDLSLDNNSYFQYKVSFTTPDSSITPSLSFVNIDYTILNTPPLISITSPQNGGTYGYNETLNLNFTVLDSENNIESCWYNIDNNEDISLSSCQNTTFNVSENSHTLKIYVNDTNGESALDSVNFTIQLGAPTIILHSPINIYLNYSNIQFNYTPTDIDLDSCELWGDFNGSFRLNQTDNSPFNGAVNSFNLDLTDGEYLWNIKCNDSLGNSAFNGNKSFYIDTINPGLSLTEPVGTKTSRTGISLEFSVSDISPVSCLYNVYSGASLEIENTSVNCSETSSFNVSADANFVLNFYVNDSAGNINNSDSSFSVDTSSPPSTGSNSGGGGGGGGSGILVKPLIINELNLSLISDFVSEPGEIRKVSLNVKNSGTGFLNNCKLKGFGNYSSWIKGGETKNLASGEEYEFIFSINIPNDSDSGSYRLSVGLSCKEIKEKSDFNIDIINKKLKFNLITVKKEGDDKIKVVYSLGELSGVNQNVDIEFLFFDSNNERIAEYSETKLISAYSNETFESLININPSIEGSLSLLVNLNSEVYSTFVQEDIFLGHSTSGFSIFGDIGNDSIFSAIIVLVFLVFVYIIFMRILNHRKKINKKKPQKKFFLFGKKS